jgi:putative acetyltransferase
MAILRPARLEDCESIWRVFTRAVRELARSHYTVEEIEAWAALRQPETFAAVIGEREFCVAEDAGAVVGYGQLDVATGEVEAVYVAPESAGRGLGRQLLEKLEEAARAAGLKSLHLRASLNAVGFYEHLGYHAERREMHRLPTGVEFAVVHMTKSLDE